MQWLKNIKFVRKIQGGFLLLAAISTIIVASGYIHLNKTYSIKKDLFTEYVVPTQKVDQMYADFQSIQYLMMQFSMPGFSSAFQANANKLTILKTSVDSSLSFLLAANLSDSVKNELTEVSNIWKDYKNIVVDAIVSASVTGNYEMASDIATTSGEEVGNKLHAKFDSVTSGLKKKADMLNTSMEDAVNQAIIFTIGGAVTGSLIFFISAFFIAPAITKPINKLKDVVNEFALGNYEQNIIVETKDEVGELTELFKKLQAAQKEKIYAAEQIAEGNLQKVNPASDKDTLAIAFNKEIDTLHGLLNEAEMLIEANKEGELSIRGNAVEYSGGWRKLIEGMNSILDTIAEPLGESSEILEIMADGDFTRRIKGSYRGAYQKIQNNINNLADSLNLTISEVSKSASEVAMSASQISSSTEEMAAGAQEQSAQTSEVAKSIEEMTRTILQTSKNASNASSFSKDAGERAKRGVEKVEDSEKGMNRIVNSAETTYSIISTLAQRTEQIGEITSVIDDIADQTNLLALNAAIEAARAGEQGRGFAVVADEVRKLAERTTRATKEIAQTIKAIQSEAREADHSMGEAKEAVNSGIKINQELHIALQEILDSSIQVSDEINQVASASEQQSAASEQISKNIDSISTVTQETTSGIHQIAGAAEDLNRLTVNLQEVIAKFNVAETAAKPKKSYESFSAVDEHLLSDNGNGNGNGNGHKSNGHGKNGHNGSSIDDWYN